jgi:3-isopropylmalate dehydrogenase
LNTYKIAVLAGDGIGPEVVDATLSVLKALSELYKFSFSTFSGLVGGAAYEKHGSHLPEETIDICKQSDAILFGSVGGPLNEAHLAKWKGAERNSILAIRKHFGFNVNLRPTRVIPELSTISPLKDDRLNKEINILVARELLGDIYFGHHEITKFGDEEKAIDVAEYTTSQVATVASFIFDFARKSKRSICMVHKANVLDTSKLWQKTCQNIHATHYSEVHYSEMLVDSCAMRLVTNPSDFDIILTSNLFGDILSDLCSALPGSLGLSPSASLNKDGFGLYEPAGGSAPDIAGKDIANPIAQILSLAMMFNLSFNRADIAQAIENAIYDLLRSRIITADLKPLTKSSVDYKIVGTKEFSKLLIETLHSSVRSPN